MYVTDEDGQTRASTLPLQLQFQARSHRSPSLIGTKQWFPAQSLALESHAMADKCNRATAGSTFLMVLPPEVRVSILTAAFGQRMMNIQRCQPATPQPQDRGSRSSGARGSTIRWLGGLFATAKSKGKGEEAPPAGRGKQWYGCICYRLPDPAVDTSPAADTCLADLNGSRRYGRWSCTSPSQVPQELAVGVMDWLLTCRQV